MELKLFILVCILQSILYCTDDSDVGRRIIYPPGPHAETGRICGGTVTPEGFAQYQCSVQLVALQYKSHHAYHTCSCAIIANKWVLTAAHCVENRSPYDTSILVGTNDLSKGGRRYWVERFIIHEQFDEPEYANDIALIELEDPIEFNDKVQPIELEKKYIPCPKGLLLTTWGYRDENDAGQENLLHNVKLNSLSNKRCHQLWSADVEISRSHLCTYSTYGHGVCMEDSGAPLVLNNKLVGIVGFGLPCGFGIPLEFPDVFTRVSSYTKWIGSNLASRFD